MKVSIIGIARSGTTAIYTLLQKIMLENHQEVQFVYEPFFWDKDVFNGEYKTVNHAFKYNDSISIEGVYQHQSLPLFIDIPDQILPNAYLTGILQPENREINILSKFIRANGRINLLKAICPEMKFIFILRNPIDSVNSIMTKFSYLGGEFHHDDFPRFIKSINTRFNENYNPGSIHLQIEKELLYWYYMNRTALETFSKFESSPLILSHEAFTDDPESVIRKMCDFLGYEFKMEYIALAGEKVGDITKSFEISDLELPFLLPFHDKYLDLLKEFGIDEQPAIKKILAKYLIKEGLPMRTMPYYGINPLGIVADTEELTKEVQRLSQIVSEKDLLISQLDAALINREKTITEVESQLSEETKLVKDLEAGIGHLKAALLVAEKESDLSALAREKHFWLMLERQAEIDQLKSVVDTLITSTAYKSGRFLTSFISGSLFFISEENREKLFHRITHFTSGKESIPDVLTNSINERSGDQIQQQTNKINLGDQPEAYYGKHRSGWAFAINSIKDLHNDKGILFDSFIERTFYWGPSGVKTHNQPWVGVIHVPPNVPLWFQHGQSNESIFNTPEWKESYPYCRGLFALSNYHKCALEKVLDVEINTLIHPTEFPDSKWSSYKFLRNKEKKIIQVGWWLRKMHSIYLLPVKNYTKIFLRKEDADLDELLRLELAHMDNSHLLTQEVLDSAVMVPFIPNNNYDQLLSENIVFLDLYDSSANNAIIECIVRNTPILVNRIEPVVEYLGPDYPLYFDTLNEAAQKAEDINLVLEAHLYLCDYPNKHKLSGAFFRQSVIQSNIYRRIR